MRGGLPPHSPTIPTATGSVVRGFDSLTQSLTEERLGAQSDVRLGAPLGGVRPRPGRAARVCARLRQDSDGRRSRWRTGQRQGRAAHRRDRGHDPHHGSAVARWCSHRIADLRTGIHLSLPVAGQRNLLRRAGGSMVGAIRAGGVGFSAWAITITDPAATPTTTATTTATRTTTNRNMRTSMWLDMSTARRRTNVSSRGRSC